MTKKYFIHPAVGIARVGDSVNEIYIAPEVPGTFQAPEEIYSLSLQSNSDTGETELMAILKIDPPDFNYRDSTPSQGIRRQGARFKIYEYDYVDEKADPTIKEVSIEDFDIEWKVKLANLKSTKHNIDHKNEPDEISLEASPLTEKVKFFEEATIQHNGQSVALPPLGEIYTDKEGRLIVVGGSGNIKRLDDSAEIEANYETHLVGWFDDASDGYVKATLTNKNTLETIEAEQAWVVVAPPKYGGSTMPLVSLYDVMEDSVKGQAPQYSSYTEQVFPIFYKTILMQWVSNNARTGHGSGGAYSFWNQLTTEPPTGQKTKRVHLFNSVQNNVTTFNPGTNEPNDISGMPKLVSYPQTDVDKAGPFLTQRQIKLIEGWSSQNVPSPVPSPLPRPSVSIHTYLENLPVQEQPAALDKAHMETVCTKCYKPGVDVGQTVEAMWDEDSDIPRVMSPMQPGQVTQSLPVPWQVDMTHCQDAWWPTSYPAWVLRASGGARERFNTKFGAFDDNNNDATRLDARREGVNNWSKMGFIKRQDYIDGAPSSTADETTEHLLKEEIT